MSYLVILALGFLLMELPVAAASDTNILARTSVVYNFEEKEDKKSINDLEHVLESSWF